MQQEDFFNEIQEHHIKQMPFVVYSKPKANSIKAFLQEDRQLYTTKDFNESGFVFAPFNLDKETVIIPETKANVLILNLNKFLENTSGNTELDCFYDKEKHLALVDSGIKAIHNGEFSKVVLSRLEEVKLTNSNPIDLFKKLLNGYPDAFVYCFYHPKIGCWLGATPETLLNVEGNKLTTVSLAGTQKYNGELEVNWNDKEIEEQRIVTDFVLDSLISATSTIEATKPKTVKAGKVLHLQSKITGVLKDTNLKQLISTLHPTPAVCGFPKHLAKQFILNNEAYDRAFYTGFLGELNQKQKITRSKNRRNIENNAYISIKIVTDLYVNLRCVQLEENKALLYVGGGITKDSVPEKEWQETVYKTSTIKNCLE